MKTNIKNERLINLLMAIAFSLLSIFQSGTYGDFDHSAICSFIIYW